MTASHDELPQHDGGATWIPTVIVIVTLIGSLAVPVFVFHRVNELRSDVTDIAEPAREHLANLLLAFSTEVSNFRAYLLDGNESHLRRYEDARRTEAQELASLARYMREINGGSGANLARVRELIDRRHEAHEGLFSGEATREDYIQRLSEAQESYAEVSGQLGLLQEMIRTYQSDRRRQIDETVTVGGMVIVALVFLGLIAAMVVSRLSFRLDSYSAELERRAREELAFRRVASGLNAAGSVVDVLRQASEAASEITRADGAYVEQIIAGAGTVEVVATIGTGTPIRGTIVPYPGSLTDEILSRGEPVIAASVREIGEATAPYIEERCPKCELVVVPLLSEGQELGALVLLNAATERKRFRPSDVRRARVLGDLAAVAMRRVAVLESERHARETAEEAVRARDDILSVVSHDLRAPLTSISLGAQMLEMQDSGNLEVRTIREAAERMQRLVDDLLDTARIQSGRLSLRKDQVDPKTIVENACRAFHPAAANRRQRLECDAEEGLAAMIADPDRLMQVFGNLITNAIKFTPDEGRISVRARRDEGAIRFIVCDSGPGIPRKALTEIFKPHWQAKKTAHLGAGLGLTIARGIVEAHGGSIWVENDPGGGAAFHFTIPA